MRAVPDWTEYFLDLAQVTASRSKDPNTQVGAVIVNNDGRIVAQGYNGMIAGAHDNDVSWADDQKDDLVIHAEVNAVANAARTGVSTLGATIYITIAPCLACMRIIAAAGIRCVVSDRRATARRVEDNPVRRAALEQSYAFAVRAGVHWREA